MLYIQLFHLAKMKLLCKTLSGKHLKTQMCRSVLLLKISQTLRMGNASSESVGYPGKFEI